MPIIKSFFSLLAVMTLSMGLVGCDLVNRVESRAKSINEYERVALALSKENRELKAEVSRLQYEKNALDSKNSYLQTKLGEGGLEKGRSLASIPSGMPHLPQKNQVDWDVYQWTPEQLFSTARQSFKNENFVKSAEFYHALALHYPDHPLVDDKFYYQAGIAAFESGRYHDWTLYHMDKLIENYPTSRFYRGAKLWSALTNLQIGEDEKFFDTVEEFRKKYRNTQEWRILSVHYQEIMHEFQPEL